MVPSTINATRGTKNEQILPSTINATRGTKSEQWCQALARHPHTFTPGIKLNVTTTKESKGANTRITF